MDNLEYIDAFFIDELSAERKREFEQKIASDPVFAEEVAFYLSSKKVAFDEGNEEREKFKHLYKHGQPANQAVKHEPALLRKLWPWAAAAAVMAGVIFGLSIWFKPVSSPTELADAYISKNLQVLSVTMGREDSLQAGLRLFNEGRLEESLKQFEALILNDTTFIEAKKYAGIVSLRLGYYDKAIIYFSQFENIHLYVNPAKFYHALTLVKRNRPGDKQQAKILLENVVKNDLYGAKAAKDWLKKW